MRYLHHITSEKGFIDLHNHTNSSFGDEMNRMNLTPLALLQEAAEYANKFNTKVTFSITDHNNTNGNREVLEEIKKHPNLYRNVNFIPGCEYTVGTDSLGMVVDGKGRKKSIIDGKVHMLAYDMDLDDPVVKYVNDIMSTENKYMKRIKNTPVKTGSLITATKKWLEQKGIMVGVDEFQKHCPILSNFDDTAKEIAKFLISKFNYSQEIINDWKKFVYDDQNLMRYAKLDVLELMSVIQNAGGYTVLAHPAIYKPSKHLQTADFSLIENAPYEEIAYTEEEEQISIMSMRDQRVNDNKMENFYDHIFKSLTVDAYNPITKEKLDGIVGFELLHCANQFKYTKFDSMYEAGNRYGLYVTCGSDSHGDYHPHALFSRVVPDRVEFNLIEDKNQKLSHIAVTQNQFVDDLIKSHNTNQRLHRSTNRSLDDQMTITVTDYKNEYSMSLGEYHYAMGEALEIAKEKESGKKGGKKGGKRHHDLIEQEEDALENSFNL